MSKFTEMLIKGFAAYGAVVSGDYQTMEWLKEYCK